MNWKLIFIGGIVFYAVVFVLGFITGPLIHEGVLEATYEEHSEFWVPELRQDPPDMAALMPRWIISGLIWGFVVAGIYGLVRGACEGPGWKRGLYYGIALAILNAATLLGWSGVMDLPANVWIWWAIDGLIGYVIGAIALGWVADKVAPAEGAPAAA